MNTNEFCFAIIISTAALYNFWLLWKIFTMEDNPYGTKKYCKECDIVTFLAKCPKCNKLIKI